MAVKKQVGKQLTEIKTQLAKFSADNTKIMELLEKKAGDQTSSDMLKLFKFMIDENRKNSMVLTGLVNAVSQLTTEAEREEQHQQPEVQQSRLDELPISDTDARILEHVQVKGMACAEDIQRLMGYKGKNAACARLSSLLKRGVLYRYQLGHKVYYKYDAGKATTTLIISPPH